MSSCAMYKGFECGKAVRRFGFAASRQSGSSCLRRDESLSMVTFPSGAAMQHGRGAARRRGDVSVLGAWLSRSVGRGSARSAQSAQCRRATAAASSCQAKGSAAVAAAAMQRSRYAARRRDDESMIGVGVATAVDGTWVCALSATCATPTREGDGFVASGDTLHGGCGLSRGAIRGGGGLSHGDGAVGKGVLMKWRGGCGALAGLWPTGAADELGAL